jgi:signal transduction histidine kinase
LRRLWQGVCIHVSVVTTHERVPVDEEVARVRREAELELRRRDQRNAEFLAMLAHELRNPLAPLRNGLQLLRLATENTVSRERVQELMEQQLSHLVRLVDDLLDVSRISRGKVELQRERLDLSAMVRGVVEATRPLLFGAGHELVVDVPPYALPLDADPVRLPQVLASLLNNAAKYTRKPGRIALTVRPDGMEAVVSVKDTGVGTTPNMHARVFDLFKQVESGTGTQGGLGIGLTLVKSLVELHGGSVEAKSDRAGEGSEFIVRLPLAPGHATLHRALAASAAFRSG